MKVTYTLWIYHNNEHVIMKNISLRGNVDIGHSVLFGGDYLTCFNVVHSEDELILKLK